MLNLLHYPLIVTSYQGERIRLSLPHTLHALANDEVDDFTHLLPRQRQLWHEFMCRLAVNATLHSKTKQLPQSKIEWYEALTALTKDRFPLHEPWELTSTNADTPAFLQPPMPPNTARTLSKPAPYPLKVHPTVGAKPPRDVAKHLPTPDIDHWIYFMVEAQTAHLRHTQYPRLPPVSNRLYHHPTMSISPGTRPGPRFLHDSKKLLDAGCDSNPANALHWLNSWDGRTQHPANREEIHSFPLALRVNRLIRLVPTPDGSAICEAPTPQPKYGSAFQLTVHHDPWSATQTYRHTARREHQLTNSHAARLTDAANRLIPQMALYSPHNAGIQDPTLIISISSLSHRQRCQSQTMEIPIAAEEAYMLNEETTHNELICQISKHLANRGRQDRKRQRTANTALSS